MKVLVTNDDGVFAEGIKLLVEKLMPYASKITVVAPLTEALMMLIPLVVK